MIKFAIGFAVARGPIVAEGLTPEERDQLASAGMAWGMGCSIVAGILISVIGGLLLDQVTGQTPLFTLIGVALGMFLAGYQLWELAQLSSRSGKVGPVARRVVRVQLAGKDRKSRQK